MEKLGEYPIQVAALIFIIKVMWDYIKELKSKSSGKTQNTGADGVSDNLKHELYDMSKQIKDMHEWMGKEDRDGRKLIYTPTSHEECLKKISEGLDRNTAMIERLNVTLVKIENS